MNNWHREPRSRKLLAKLDSSCVTQVERVSIPADFYEYVGADDAACRVFRLLENRRTRAIERALGCSFDEACADRSRRDEILSILDAAPSVSQAVGETLR
jgi:hypothetical protein